MFAQMQSHHKYPFDLSIMCRYCGKNCGKGSNLRYHIQKEHPLTVLPRGALEKEHPCSKATNELFENKKKPATVHFLSPVCNMMNLDLVFLIG